MVYQALIPMWSLPISHRASVIRRGSRLFSDSWPCPTHPTGYHANLCWQVFPPAAAPNCNVFIFSSGGGRYTTTPATVSSITFLLHRASTTVNRNLGFVVLEIFGVQIFYNTHPIVLRYSRPVYRSVLFALLLYCYSLLARAWPQSLQRLDLRCHSLLGFVLRPCPALTLKSSSGIAIGLSQLR